MEQSEYHLAARPISEEDAIAITRALMCAKRNSALYAKRKSRSENWFVTPVGSFGLIHTSADYLTDDSTGPFRNLNSAVMESKRDGLILVMRGSEMFSEIYLKEGKAPGVITYARNADGILERVTP